MSSPLITVTEARRLVLDAAGPLGSEPVAVDGALDRILAADITAGGDVPPFACSAMDGYAVAPGPAGRVLTVVGESRAGSPAAAGVGSPASDEAIRISTGAAVPPGAAAVIRQEDVRSDGDGKLVTTAAVAAGANIRGAGDDMRAGATVLRRGTRLGPLALGAAVAAGAAALSVARRPRVAVLCTGDELRAPGEPLGPGQIHNSNAPMLSGLAARCGAAVVAVKRLADDSEITRAGIAAALEHADVVVISGGVSVGPHDHVRPALASLGVRQHFWGLALQPGKPTWFGATPDGRLVFGLPGNPVSAAVTFSLFVAPALAALQGAPLPRPPRERARLGADVPRNRRREQALRVSLGAGDTDEAPVATPTGPQGSHILTSLLAADALAMIPPGEEPVAAGTMVTLSALVR